MAQPPVAPPGWPRDLPPPDSEEFGDRVVAWLLDRAPGGWRAHLVLRRQPRALALLVRHVQQSRLEGLRVAYSAARRELGEFVEPHELNAIMTALEAEGASTAETVRELGLVADALAGVRWRRRL